MAEEADRTPAVPADGQAMRASDADRERVAQALHEAAGEGRLSLDELRDRLDSAYSAKTYGELAPIVADLPGVTAPRRPAHAYDGDDATRAVLGIWSGPARRGDWLVPRTQIAVAFMGGVVLDLRHARFSADETTIQAYAVMGGIEILVPEGMDVRIDGVGLMGGFDDAASGPGDGTGPCVRITGFAFWGGVDVRRPHHS
ncbi:DUF1707 SHOCT-like domain-containing protein [Actinocatenispora rupis]|uniref:Cell wall-active antibiotics response 4TMS YvqF n=1 Tax=Actinocatenispora rupis TaxID=519421 RepID=A0A8J3NCH6_9ACTN|nr:DUF1707 domain-containing protein [Actinocatenispora rupis]GID10454.1 hypothetical protein Aru02nite_13430 [Actinocatenispora rupis]